MSEIVGFKATPVWGYTAESGWDMEVATCTFKFAVLEGGYWPPGGTVVTLPEATTYASKSEVGVDDGINYQIGWAADFPNGSEPDQVFGRELQIAAAKAIRQWWNDIRQRCAPMILLTGMRISPIWNGEPEKIPGSNFTLVTPIPGNSPSGSLVTQPPEVATVVSLRAAVPGRKGRGRVYVPGVVLVNPATNYGRVDTGIRSTLRTGTRDFIYSMYNLDAAPGSCSFASIVTGDRPTTGIIPGEVRVGDHYDVQRRRQNARNEVYSTTALEFPPA